MEKQLQAETELLQTPNDPRLIYWTPANIFSSFLSLSALLLYLVTFVLSAPSSLCGGLCLSSVTSHPPCTPCPGMLAEYNAKLRELNKSIRVPRPPLNQQRSFSGLFIPPPSFPLLPSPTSLIHPSPSLSCILPSHPPSFSHLLSLLHLHPSFPLILPSCSMHAECSVCCMHVGWREAQESISMQDSFLFSAEW